MDHVDGRMLSVSDEGGGVPEGEKERIFERFHRVDNSLTRRMGGSGLGLAIARALVRGMGGDVRYSRRDVGGSVFSLSLPAPDGRVGA